jgi:uncharacterized membrane protein
MLNVSGSCEVTNVTGAMTAIGVIICYWWVIVRRRGKHAVRMCSEKVACANQANKREQGQNVWDFEEAHVILLFIKIRLLGDSAGQS